MSHVTTSYSFTDEDGVLWVLVGVTEYADDIVMQFSPSTAQPQRF